MPIHKCQFVAMDTIIVLFSASHRITHIIFALFFLASVGGMWLVAPGRYSVYFGNQKVKGLGAAYPFLLGDIIGKFEEASMFMVTSDTDDGLDDGDDAWEELEVCGDGIWEDRFEVEGYWQPDGVVWEIGRAHV